MKRMGWVLGTALLCVGTAFGASQGEVRQEAKTDLSAADDTNTVTWAGNTPIIRLPPGETQWSAVLAPPFQADRMAMSYFRTPECPFSPGVQAFVRNADSGVWYLTQIKDGIDTFPSMKVDQVWFKFQQTTYGIMGCRFHLEFTSAVTTTTPPPTSSEGEVLAGAISFPGGYAPGLSLKMPPETAIKSFRIASPSFCTADVLEAGTVTEGIYDPATLLEKTERSYSVNHGYGSRISEIRVSLNGPANSPCSLPVYVKTAKE